MNLKELSAYLKRPDKSKYVTLKGNDKLKEYNLYINGTLVSNEKDKINAAPYLSSNNVLRVVMNYTKDDGLRQRQSKMFDIGGMFPEGSESYFLIMQTPEQFASLEYPLQDISLIEAPAGILNDSVYVSLINRMYKNGLLNDFMNRRYIRDFGISRSKDEGMIFVTEPLKPGKCPREDVKFLADKLGIKDVLPTLNNSLGYYRTFDFQKETEPMSCMLKMKSGANFVAENLPGSMVCVSLPKYNGQAIDGTPFELISEIKKYPDEKIRWSTRREKDVEIFEMRLVLGNSKYENMADELLEIYGLDFSN